MNQVVDDMGIETAIEIYDIQLSNGGEINDKDAKRIGLDLYGVGLLEAQYKLNTVGMTLAEYDYMEREKNYQAATTLMTMSAIHATIAKANNLPKVSEPNGGVKYPTNNPTQGTYNSAKTPRTGAEWNEYFKSKYGSENVSWKGTEPGDYLNKALNRQGLNTAPNSLKETWIEGDYKFEVRIHPADPSYGKAGSIYRVSRQRINISNGQGTGTEYMGSDGNWYHESFLKPGKSGNVNPNFNNSAAESTHIQLP